MLDSNTSKRLRRLARRRREGMTLIEIMIVVIIMALIATAVGVAVLPQFTKAKIRTAETNVHAIREGVQAYILDGYDGCPTVADLIETREIDETSETTDPWGNDYAIECNGDNVTVTSAGEDGQMGTEDDISTARNRAND